VDLTKHNYLGQVQFSWTNKGEDDIVYSAFLFCDRFDEKIRQIVVTSKSDRAYAKHPFWTGNLLVWQAGDGYLYDAKWTSVGEWLINYMMYKYEHRWDSKTRNWAKATAEQIAIWKRDWTSWKPWPGSQPGNSVGAIGMQVMAPKAAEPPAEGKLAFDDNFNTTGSILRGRKQ
jgi:hypothetical protein